MCRTRRVRPPPPPWLLSSERLQLLRQLLGRTLQRSRSLHLRTSNKPRRHLPRDPTRSPRQTGELGSLHLCSVDHSRTCSQSILLTTTTTTTIAPPSYSINSSTSTSDDSHDPPERCSPKPNPSTNGSILSFVPPPLFGVA